jgi:hypothetical protein
VNFLYFEMEEVETSVGVDAPICGVGNVSAYKQAGGEWKREDKCDVATRNINTAESEAAE